MQLLAKLKDLLYEDNVSGHTSIITMSKFKVRLECLLNVKKWIDGK